MKADAIDATPASRVEEVGDGGLWPLADGDIIPLELRFTYTDDDDSRVTITSCGEWVTMTAVDRSGLVKSRSVRPPQYAWIRFQRILVKSPSVRNWAAQYGRPVPGGRNWSLRVVFRTWEANSEGNGAFPARPEFSLGHFKRVARAFRQLATTDSRRGLRWFRRSN